MRGESLIVPIVRINVEHGTDIDASTKHKMEVALNGTRCTACDSCFGAEQCLYGTRIIDARSLVSSSPTLVARHAKDGTYAGSVCLHHVTDVSFGGALRHVCTVPAMLVTTLCVDTECRKSSIGSIILKHVLRRYSQENNMYLTVRPKRPESECRPEQLASRRELNSRVDKLLGFYKKHGFRIIEKGDHIWLLKYVGAS